MKRAIAVLVLPLLAGCRMLGGGDYTAYKEAQLRQAELAAKGKPPLEMSYTDSGGKPVSMVINLPKQPVKIEQQRANDYGGERPEHERVHEPRHGDIPGRRRVNGDASAIRGPPRSDRGREGHDHHDEHHYYGGAVMHDNNELFRRIQMMLVYTIGAAILLVLFGCADPQTEARTIPAPWGAVDFCQRHPESVWCQGR